MKGEMTMTNTTNMTSSSLTDVTDKAVMYRKSGNKLSLWQIELTPTSLIIKWGEVDGQMQSQVEVVKEGLAGRSVAQQLTLQYESRIKKKVDAGYVFSSEEAAKGLTNSLGLKKPMLALPFDKAKGLDLSTSYIQYKYDGHRCMVHVDDEGELTAYSRNGKVIETCNHIMKRLAKMNLKRGITLDGELYHHGTRLQTITSWVKREQINTERLVYVIYDVMMDGPYKDRLEYLYENFPVSTNAFNSASIAPTTVHGIRDEDAMLNALGKAINNGYEGLILRNPKSRYQDGKRNSSLVKVKQWLDDEFEIIDVVPSKEGLGILVCALGDGSYPAGLKEFRVTAPGTFEEKAEALENRGILIGKQVTVQYANLTKDGKPFHPVAKVVHHD